MGEISVDFCFANFVFFFLDVNIFHMCKQKQLEIYIYMFYAMITFTRLLKSHTIYFQMNIISESCADQTINHLGKEDEWTRGV